MIRFFIFKQKRAKTIVEENYPILITLLELPYFMTANVQEKYTH